MKEDELPNKLHMNKIKKELIDINPIFAKKLFSESGEITRAKKMYASQDKLIESGCFISFNFDENTYAGFLNLNKHKIKKLKNK
jgi:hypothetical protein